MPKTIARRRRRDRSPFAGATRPDLRMLRTLATGIERHTIGVVFKAGNVSCRCGHRLGPPPPGAHRAHPTDDGGVPRQAAGAGNLRAAPGRVTPAEGLPPRRTHTVDRPVGRHLSTITDRRPTHSTRGSTTA
jgi:hypothetical protein